MSDDDDAMAVIFCGGIILIAAMATIHYTNMPVLLYIALFLAVTELIYIQYIKIESNEFISSISDSDLIEKTQTIKLWSIFFAAFAIPIITVVLYALCFLFVYMREVLILLGVVVLIIILWSTFIYINTYAIRFRKKELEKRKKLEEESIKHPGPALD